MGMGTGGGKMRFGMGKRVKSDELSVSSHETKETTASSVISPPGRFLRGLSRGMSLRGSSLLPSPSSYVDSTHQDATNQVNPNTILTGKLEDNMQKLRLRSPSFRGNLTSSPSIRNLTRSPSQGNGLSPRASDVQTSASSKRSSFLASLSPSSPSFDQGNLRPIPSGSASSKHSSDKKPSLLRSSFVGSGSSKI
ncbi:hypothetical protein B484DRAFT_458600, partial [Ochromonadaceae sp. CCMP2298]